MQQIAKRTSTSEQWLWRGNSIDGTLPTKSWISARVMAALSHYPPRQLAADVRVMAMADWITALAGLPVVRIEAAFIEYINSQAEWAPTPGRIRAMAREGLRTVEEARRIEELEIKLGRRQPAGS